MAFNGDDMYIERKFLFTLSVLFMYTGMSSSFAYELDTSFVPSSSQTMPQSVCDESIPPKCSPLIYPNSQVPMPSISKAFRLYKGLTNILFNSYPSIGARFVDNLSSQDFFVSQATEGEMRAFLQYSVPGLNFAYAVAPTSYTAKPSYCSGAFDESMKTDSDKILNISVPPASYSFSSPVIINFYTRLNGTLAKPAETIMKVGSTSRDSEVKFTFARQDCSDDGIGNRSCTTANIIEAQQIVFSAVLSKDNYIWDTLKPAQTSTYYVSLNDGPYEPLENCAASFAPPINGICGLAINHGFSEAPQSGLCASGKRTRPEKMPGRWEWTCRGVSGGINAKCAAAAS